MPDDTLAELIAATGSESAKEKRAHLIVEALRRESDRGCAIFAAAFLDGDLERLLRTYFRQDPGTVKKVVDPLFRTYAPLSTFSAKIQICFALGLLTKRLHRRLEVFRRIRNELAHDASHMSLDVPSFQDLLRPIVSARIPEPRGSNQEEAARQKGPRKPVRREALVIAAADTASILSVVIALVKRGMDVRGAVQRLEEAGF